MSSTTSWSHRSADLRPGYHDAHGPESLVLLNRKRDRDCKAVRVRDQSGRTVLALAFTPGARVLDVGCGSGRDAARLLDSGYDAYDIEPVHALRNAARAVHPELAGRIAEGGLPRTGDAFGGEFDGILCSAALMHVPDTDLLDPVRRLLTPEGRLLRSIPAARRDLLSGDRDTNGRLFRPTQPTRAPGGCIRLH